MSEMKPCQTMRGHTKWVRGVAHLLDRQHIITCSLDGSLRLWDLESGAQIENEWRDGHGRDSAISAMALSPDGKIVAVGNMDGTVRLWDIEKRRVTSKWTGHAAIVWSISWNADSERVVTASQDGTVRVWDVKSGKTVLDPIYTGHMWVFAVAYSPDTSKIATGGYMEEIKIWDARTGKLLSEVKHKDSVFSLAWTSDQEKLISGSANGIAIFSTAAWHQIATLSGHPINIPGISLLQNNRLLVSASQDGTACLWNLDTNLQVGPPLQHRQSVYATSFSGDGKFLVTGCTDGNTYVWDIHTILKDAGCDDLLSLQTNVKDLTNHIVRISDHPITSGGFGDIWKYDLVKPDGTVQVAVKTIRALDTENDTLMQKNAKRVRRELKIWGRLKHECILPLWGVANNLGPYPAMICPWVKNGALAGFLERQQDTLSLQDKFSLLNDIAAGLQYLHNKSVVHGDLTGSNVLVYDNGRACLADFGLSTMVLEFIGTSYLTTSIRGNIRWAAAELFEVSEDEAAVESLSTECDIYSFGSITLQVLTCKVPYYNVKKDLVVMRQVINGKKPEPPEKPEIASVHWEFIERCWLPRSRRP